MSFARHSRPHRARLVLATIAFLVAAQVGWVENATVGSSTPLTASQIVDQMQRHNQVRTNDLKHYQSLRSYEVKYKGFPALAAKMTVEADFDSTAGKSFRIVSQSGSKFLVDKVLKRLIETEREAGNDQKSTALTAANYTFRLDGTESVAGRPAYILVVEPLVKSKFLYRGKIWVDSRDFAVAMIEAQPAQNPSFWISKTQIHHEYAKTDAFWLPQKNRSETKVRLGGTAVLTIDYGIYQVVPAAVVPGGGS